MHLSLKFSLSRYFRFPLKKLIGTFSSYEVIKSNRYFVTSVQRKFKLLRNYEAIRYVLQLRIVLDFHNRVITYSRKLEAHSHFIAFLVSCNNTREERYQSVCSRKFAFSNFIPRCFTLKKLFHVCSTYIYEETIETMYNRNTFFLTMITISTLTRSNQF